MTLRLFQLTPPTVCLGRECISVIGATASSQDAISFKAVEGMYVTSGNDCSKVDAAINKSNLVCSLDHLPALSPRIFRYLEIKVHCVHGPSMQFLGTSSGVLGHLEGCTSACAPAHISRYKRCAKSVFKTRTLKFVLL